MIESIYQIGRAILREGEGDRLLLESLADSLPKVKKGNPHLAVLEVDIENKKLDLDLRELSATDYEKSAARYLWLGNPIGANNPQDRLTTNNLTYLVSQTVPNLVRPGNLASDSSLHKSLSDFLAMYSDIGEAVSLNIKSGGAYSRYRRFWDLDAFGVEGKSLNEVREQVRSEGSAKSVPLMVSKAVQDHFGSRLPSEGVLYTLKLDGNLLIDDDAYQEYLVRNLIGSVFEDAKMGRCHLSGEKAPVTTNMTRFRFKYYITDKQGFASGASQNGFDSNLALSEIPYKSLLMGERFIRREMGLYLAGTSGYLIPDLFTLEVPTGIHDALKKTLRGVKGRTELQLGIQRELDNKLDDLRDEFDASGYMMNLLFYKQNKANFRVLQLIQDVPDYRLEELATESSKIGKIGDELFGSRSNWNLSLKSLYYMMPVRKSGTDYLSKSVLTFYASLISGGLMDHKTLIDDYIELIRIYRFGNYGAYHVSEPKDPDWELLSYVARSNLLTKMIRNLNQLKEETMSLKYLDDLELDDTQRSYLEKLNYGKPEQTAMYLFGVLIGDIANAQYRLGPNGKGGPKTILNKINYQGMTVSRVQRLATELFDKLTQYRHRNRTPLLDARNEKIYFQAQSLLTEKSNNWSLSPAENVYYLLSGYSHTTFQAIKRRSDQTGKPEQKGQDE